MSFHSSSLGGVRPVRYRGTLRATGLSRAGTVWRRERSRLMKTKLFVGNLPYTVTEERLLEMFQGDGRSVSRVTIV
ncbi:MAG: hypothetical protein ACYTGK_06875, partial [Planctomycetota bacterium]